MGYFASKTFAISLVAGLVLAGTFLALPTIAPELVNQVGRPCDPVAGTPLASANGHHLNYKSGPADQIQACVESGQITIVAEDRPDIDVQISIASAGRGAAERIAGTEVQIIQGPGSLAIIQTKSARVTWWLGGEGADVTLDIRVPHNLSASFDIDLGVGNLVAKGLNGTQNHQFATGVGNVQVSFESLDFGTIEVSADVGNVALIVPTHVPYEIDASTDVGTIDNSIPNTVMIFRQHTAPGDTLRAESRDLPSHVDWAVLVARADVGDIRLSAQ